MPISPITFALVSGIGGGCVGIPLLFWKYQTSDLVKSKIDSQVVSPSASLDTTTREQVSGSPSSSVTPMVKAGNCEVIKTPEDVVNFLWSLGGLNEDYVTISCKNTNSEDSEKNIKDWIGAFPSDLIVNSWNLSEGSWFNVKTNTSEKSDSSDLVTVFSSDRFITQITGEWGEQSKTEKGRTVTTVKTEESSKSIYLII